MDIIHDESESRFTVKLDMGEAYLLYRRVDDTTLDFWYTYVPRALRGRNIAETLVRRGYAYARLNALKVKPTCSYVRWLADRDPKLGALTV
jgi:predicted GNAT family acetyltransferase